jgi:hypothetical protein
VSALAAGSDDTCALQAHDVVCWGNNTFGQLGVPLLYSSQYPRLVDP